MSLWYLLIIFVGLLFFNMDEERTERAKKRAFVKRASIIDHIKFIFDAIVSSVLTSAKSGDPECGWLPAPTCGVCKHE